MGLPSPRDSKYIGANPTKKVHNVLAPFVRKKSVRNSVLAKICMFTS